MELTLTILYERDGEWWTSTCPEVPGAVSSGKSKEEARMMVLDAIRELSLARLDLAERELEMQIVDRETLRLPIPTSVPAAA